MPQVLTCGAIAVICFTLIALIWINTGRAIREQYEDTRGRAEANVSTQAATLAVQVQHELLMVDQSLAVLQAAWDNNPDAFKLSEWRQRMPALTAVADDLFIANDRHVIIQDVNQAAVGQGIGSAYATFATGSLEPIVAGEHDRDNAMLIGELGDSGIVRHYLMYLVRPLTRPNGWLVGASYKSKALTDVFAGAGLGREGLAALIDTHRGGVQALAGLAALHPKLSISSSPMYAAMMARPDGGIWIGPTAIDGVNRILAFRRVPDRDLFVLAGVARIDAMTPAATWAAAANTVAATATLLVLAIGATVLWEVWHWRRTRRRQRNLVQAEELLQSVQAELGGMRLRAVADVAHIQAILDGVSEGVGVFDSEHRLAVWNPRFAALCGLADGVRDGLPLEELLRQQAEAGQFGVLEDVQAEIDRRLTLLHGGGGVMRIEETAPDGTPREVWAEATRDGGLVLVLHGTLPPSAIEAEPELPILPTADTVEL